MVEAETVGLKPKRICVIKARAIGDVVMTTPSLRSLRAAFPDAHITMFVREFCADVVRHLPYLDNIFVYEKAGNHGGLAGRLRLIRELRSRKFDLVVNFHDDFQTVLFAFLSGAEIRLGFKNKWDFLLTHKLTCPEELHIVDRHLALLELIGVRGSNRKLELVLTEADRSAARRFLQGHGLLGRKLVGMVAGSQWQKKRWPAESFAQVNDVLAEFGVAVILIGSPSEVPYLRSIAALTKFLPTIAAGETSLIVSAALLEHCNVVLTNDTGPMHIAGALGRPIVALFGPTDPEKARPPQAPSIVLWKGRICDKCTGTICQELTCLRGIGVAEVIDALTRYLDVEEDNVTIEN